MTNNFEEIKKYIQKTYQYSGITYFGPSFDKNDDTFFSIDLIRRGKDHPGLPAANYLFRNYHIEKISDIDKFKDEIITLCDTLKLRAYFTINRKSYRKCLWKQNELIAKRIYDGDYKKPYKLWQSSVNMFHHQTDKRWIVDIDDKDIDLQIIRDAINSTNAGEHRIISELPTKNGHHFITLPFDIIDFNLKMSDKFGIDKVPDIKKNNLTLLYENI